MKTLYQALTEAGIQCRNWQSDLYVPVTEKSRAILVEYPKQSKTVFKSNVTGELMFDCPFAFDPFWERRKA
jgi:hypothetical protein